jgi:hypothetical protein
MHVRDLGRCGVLSLVSLFATLATASPASSDPTFGFVENFSSPGIGSWGGGSTLANPLTGGFGGVGDGFLQVSTTAAANLGARSDGPEYAGNWTAAGINEVHLWLNDVGADEPLEIHFLIGPASNFWSYNVGFAPPLHSWAEFVVPLNGPTGWTRTIGTTGTFADALTHVEQILIRHDKAPFIQQPDPLKGDFGIDHIVLTNNIATATTPTTWGRIKTLYR